MKLFSIIFLVVLIAISFSNCKKDHEKAANALYSKIWKYGVFDKNSSTTPSGKVLYQAVPNCQQDDMLSFKSDGRLIINRGTEKCDINEQTIDTVHYSYNKTTKEFVINDVKYFLVEESNTQIKYYAHLSSMTGYDFLVFLLQ